MINEEQSIEAIFNEILSFDEEEAFKYCVEGYEESGNPEYLLYRGHAHLVFGEYEEAIESVDAAVNEGCDNYVYAYNIKGEALLELGLYVESRSNFEKTLEFEENNFLATTFLVELDIREEFYQEAIDRCNKYIELYGDIEEEVGDLNSILGWIYLVDVVNKEKAYEAFKIAVSKNRNCARAYTGLGIYHVGKGEFRKAIEAFEKAIEIDDSDGENYFGIAICYKELKEFDKVEDYLIKADALEPEDTRILMELGFEFLRQDKIDIARECFKELMSIDPDNNDIKTLLEEIEI